MGVWCDSKAQVLTPVLFDVLGVCCRISHFREGTEAQGLVQAPRGVAAELDGYQPPDSRLAWAVAAR